MESRLSFVLFCWMAVASAQGAETVSVASLENAVIPLFRAGESKSFGVVRVKWAGLEKARRGYFRVSVLRKPVIRECSAEIASPEDIFYFFQKLEKLSPNLPKGGALEIRGLTVAQKGAAPALAASKATWTKNSSALLLQGLSITNSPARDAVISLKGRNAGSIAIGTDKPIKIGKWAQSVFGAANKNE